MFATGSSYLIRQAPGAERFGGVTVKLRPRRAAVGTLEVLPTDWRTDVKIDADIQSLVDAAVVGLDLFADRNGIDLQDWDVTVSRFAYHPIDSGPHTFKIAAHNALASAWASWHSMLISFPPARVRT